MKKAILCCMLPFFALTCTSIDKDVFIKSKDKLKDQVKIAVFPFTDAPGTEGRGSGDAISEALTHEIIKISNWTIIERSQLTKIMSEKSLNMSGLTDADSTEVGRLARTDYIIVGNVSEFKYEKGKLSTVFIPKTKIVFKSRIIDTTDGSIVGSMRYNVETGKYACMGCLLGFYYIPVAMLYEENKYEELDKSAKDIVNEIRKNVEKKKGCLF